MTNRTPWTPHHYRIAANYVVTCREDGSIPLDSRIVAVVDKDVQTGALLSEMLDRANMAPAMADLLGRIADTPCDHGPQEFCPREEARALLSRLGGG